MPRDHGIPGWLARAYRYLLKGAALLLAALAVLLLARAWRSRSLPDLELWHTVRLEGEFEAGDYRADLTLQDYLARERALFAELDRKVVLRTPNSPKYALCRYNPKSPACPAGFAHDYNRTFEAVPEGPRGAVLLVHGLTDSPYSMRALAEVFSRQGLYVLALRMPGHGTVPSGIARARWQDWLAAVKLGARHCRGRAGEGRPFYIAGYSNGGALALIYALDAIDDGTLPKPDRLFLFSPAVGINKLAALADVLQAFAFIPGLQKSRWSEIFPEYDPFKYTSFPLHAAEQSHEVSQRLHRELGEARAAGRLKALPPVLTFQSAADATVLVEDTVGVLYSQLPTGGHELVLFDVNRLGQFREFFAAFPRDFATGLERSSPRTYGLTVVTNRDAASSQVVARRREADGDVAFEELGAEWPAGVYSLSHVAVPFRPDDPLYGIAPPGAGHRYHLGNLILRGEKGLLTTPVEGLMRLRCNPFFGYLERRIGDAMRRDLAAPVAPSP